MVLSDIEMPRMDGFDLARNIRGDDRMRALPIIMITSRIAEKHREHASELGVDHYLGKPYSEEELLGLIAPLLRPRARRRRAGLMPAPRGGFSAALAGPALPVSGLILRTTA